jgi:hypothetical protein
MRAFAPLAFLLINAAETLLASSQGSREHTVALREHSVAFREHSVAFRRSLLGLEEEHRASRSRRLQQISTGPFPTPPHATLLGQFVVRDGPSTRASVVALPATYTCIEACQLTFPEHAIYGGSTSGTELTGTCYGHKQSFGGGALPPRRFLF